MTGMFDAAFYQRVMAGIDSSRQQEEEQLRLDALKEREEEGKIDGVLVEILSDEGLHKVVEYYGRNIEFAHYKPNPRGTIYLNLELTANPETRLHIVRKETFPYDIKQFEAHHGLYIRGGEVYFSDRSREQHLAAVDIRGGGLTGAYVKDSLQEVLQKMADGAKR